MTQHVRIVNAKMVNEGQIIDGDLLVRDGRIANINGADTFNTPVHDARGAWLLPGMIDDQVHFREPGFEHKGEIATESRAAIAGGITSYMEMPNCNPLTVNAPALVDKHTRAAGKSSANYGFYLGATNTNLEDVKAVDTTLACGIKVFMGASTGNMLVDDTETLEGIFAAAPLLVATHCEDTPMILANEAAARAKYGEDIPFTEHPYIRSEACCYKSSSFAVSLARKYGTRLHILHITTAKELELFTPGDLADKHITAEACVHHLYFDESWYPEKGALIKCNPAIKTATDREGLIGGVNTDVIDVIATDHAPHTLEEKARPYGQAPAGLPLVQHALVSLFEHIHRGVFGIETVVEKTAHAPARLFGVKERGYLREDYWADLVLVDDKSPSRDTTIYSKCQWNPFDGTSFHAGIQATFVNGHLRYNGREILAGPPGQPLLYNR